MAFTIGAVGKPNDKQYKQPKAVYAPPKPAATGASATTYSTPGVPTFAPPKASQVSLNLPMAEMPTLDLSGMPTGQSIMADQGKQMGILRAIQEAAAQREIANTAKRLGGDTSSPVYQSLVSGISGGAAARTGAASLGAAERARQEAAQAETARAGMGLNLIGAQQNAVGLNSRNALAAAEFERATNEGDFDRALAAYNASLAANQQGFGQQMALGESGREDKKLSLAEMFQKYQMDMGDKELGLKERQQDWTENYGQQGMDLESKKFDWESAFRDRSFDWEKAFKENEFDWKKTVDQWQKQQGDRELDIREQGQKDQTALGWGQINQRRSEANQQNSASRRKDALDAQGQMWNYNLGLGTQNQNQQRLDLDRQDTENDNWQNYYNMLLDKDKNEEAWGEDAGGGSWWDTLLNWF